MFWKKEESPEMPPTPLGGELGLPGEEHLGMPPAMPGAPAAGMPAPGMPAPGMPSAVPPTPGAAPVTGAPLPPSAEPLGPSTTFAAPRLEPVVEPPAPRGTPAMTSKELELVSLKLDQLKTAVDVLNQRLAHLEKLAEEAQHPKW